LFPLSLKFSKQTIKAKKKEKMAKYMEWGKGLTQKREREEKLKNDLYEAEKPLARYKSDKDLEQILKDTEREGYILFTFEYFLFI
jgi:pre-mRNA-splicing factor CWC26